MKAQEYHIQILKLLPKGAIWDGVPLFKALLKPLAQALEYLEGRMLDLINEARPLSAVETLEDWENDWGLPDPCTGQLPTIYQRQIALWQKIVDDGGQRDIDYMEIAARMGYSITIEELQELPQGAPAPQFGSLTGRWREWVVHINSAQNQTYFRQEATTESTTEDRIDASSHFNLECVIRRLKPAHTKVYFNYNL